MDSPQNTTIDARVPHLLSFSDGVCRATRSRNMADVEVEALMASEATGMSVHILDAKYTVIARTEKVGQVHVFFGAAVDPLFAASGRSVNPLSLHRR